MGENPVKTENNWLECDNESLVEIALSGEIHDLINNVLPLIAKNFAPDVVADIVLKAINLIAEDQELRGKIITKVKSLENLAATDEKKE